MKRRLIQLGLTTLVTASLFGCGGGSDGADGKNITVPINQANKLVLASNATTPTTEQVQAWRALQPKITVTGVTIASPPVVTFSVTDAYGNAVVGLNNKSQSSTATVASLVNLRFTLAKLIPSDGKQPSRWVSYIVTKPPSVDEKAALATSLNGYTGTTGKETSYSCESTKTWCGTYPTTESEGTLVDNGDGTYKYTFKRDITQVAAVVASLSDYTSTAVAAAGPRLKADLGDLSYDPTLTHRLGIQISGAAPGTGSNTPSGATALPGVNIAIPANVVYDFRPDGQPVTATRAIVDKSSCDSCHNGKGLAHGQGRNDPNYCVTCHTDQIKYSMSGEATRSGTVLSGATNNTTAVLEGRAIGNFPNFAHKIHMGAELKLTGYNYLNAMKFNEDEWIQDPRDCTKCHSGADKTNVNQATKTKDGDNFKNKPSRLACGACHDNISFAVTVPTGLTAHTGGAASDDSSCASCHSAAGAVAPVDVAHRTEVRTPNNPVQIDGIANITYEIKSVTVDATTKAPKIVFRIMKDGVAVTTFNTPTVTANATTGVNTVQTSPVFQPITGFTGGPSFYVVYAVPQDGIASPADYNTYQSISLTNLLVNGTVGGSAYPKAGTLSTTGMSQADIDAGYLTATLTGSAGQAATVACPEPSTKLASGYCANPSLIKIPTNAKMVTGAMIGAFKQIAFTANTKAATTYGTSYPTGLIIKTPLVMKVASGSTARRVVVDSAKCNSCHEKLGSAVEFHSGANNEAQACAICHNTSRTSSGWSADASTFVHGIHAGTSPTSVASIQAITNYLTVVGDPGTGDGGAGTGYNKGKRYIPFSWHRTADFNAAKVVYPGILRNCEGCHVPNAVNFGLDGATLFPNLLWSTAVKDTLSATDTYKVYPRDPVTGDLIYVATGIAYGNVFSFTPEGSVVPRITTGTGTAAAGTLTPDNITYQTVAGSQGVAIQADPHTLVNSPITSACFACHDTAYAKNHMVNDGGGVIYGTRAASTVNGVLTNKETCLLCHGMGRVADVAVMHNKK